MRSLAKLLDLLLGSEIDFVLIGGFASVVHGSTMVTRDLDVCMLTSAEQIVNLRACLKNYNAKHRMTPQRLSFEDFPPDLSNLKSLYLVTDLGVLDVVSAVTGVGDFERIKERAVEIDIYGKKCKVISIEDLIASKNALGSAKDLAVASELEVIKKQSSDKS